MELAERYAYTVYTEKSFTAAAKALYISQPGLSAMITKLEKKLGFVIFDRSTVPLSLTTSGRIYIEYLQDMIAEESSMLSRIHQLSDGAAESLSVSVFSQTAYYLFAPLCAEFSRRHPNVSIFADIGNNGTVDSLAENLRNNFLDIVLTDTMDEKDCLSIPICREKIVIAMHKKLCSDKRILSCAVTKEEILQNSYDPDKALKDTSILQNVPFLALDDQTTSARLFSKIFHNDFNCSIYHIKNSRNLMMHYYMMREGLGATIADASHLLQPIFDDPDIVYFVSKSQSAYRTLQCVIKESRKDELLLKEFVSVAKEISASRFSANN